jgi:hypothetical protein
MPVSPRSSFSRREFNRAIVVLRREQATPFHDLVESVRQVNLHSRGTGPSAVPSLENWLSHLDHRRTCAAQADCSPGQFCCASGPVLTLQVDSTMSDPGDQRCQTTCEPSEANIECSSARDCGEGQRCCRRMAVPPFVPTWIGRLTATVCTDACDPGNTLCLETEECDEGQQCRDLLLLPGMRACRP